MSPADKESHMLYDCPECALPCTVEPRGSCTGTDGPVEIVFVRCANRHWFLGEADRLRWLVPATDAVGDVSGPAHRSR
jgi:hypothetical protein